VTADPTATAEEIAALARDTQQTEVENLGARARLASARDARVQREERDRRRGNRSSGSASTAQYDAARFDLADQINALFGLLRDAGLGSPTRARATYASSQEELADLLSAITGQASGAGYRTLERRPGESLTTFLARSSQGANDFLATRRDSLEAERQAIRDKQDSQRELEDERKRDELALRRSKGDAQTELDRTLATNARRDSERNDPLGQLTSRFAPAASEVRTAAEQMAEGVSLAFQTMTGAIKSHVGALLEGRETIGEALRGIAHETLMSLAQEAVGRSLMETAAGIAAIASLNPALAATAPAHFAAAGVYAGVAALAGAGAALTAAPATPAGAATASSRSLGSPASASGSMSGRGSAQTVTINVNGAIVDREGLEEAVAYGLRGARARGLLAA